MRLEEARAKKLEAKITLKKRLKRRALMEAADAERKLDEKARIKILKKKNKAKAARAKRKAEAAAAVEAGLPPPDDADSDSTVDSSYSTWSRVSSVSGVSDPDVPPPTEEDHVTAALVQLMGGVDAVDDVVRACDAFSAPWPVTLPHPRALLLGCRLTTGARHSC